MQGVYIPKMRADLTTQKVLIMEWVDGKRLRSAGKRRPGEALPSCLQVCKRWLAFGLRCAQHLA